MRAGQVRWRVAALAAGMSVTWVLPAMAARARLQAPTAPVVPVVLVQGTASAPNAAEQRYSQNTTRRLSRWLQNAGVAHRIVTDEGVSAGELSRASVAVLCYNPAPPPRELRRLADFIRQGGKLIVFYSAEPQLAGLMGLKLGAYVAAPAPERWTAIRFNEAAPPGLPPRVFHESHNIRPAFPATAEAKVIAWWEDSQGRVTPDPAWVQSPAGFWMSHILLDDDSGAKERLLLGLVGACDPGVWRQVAERQAAFAGAFGSFGSFEEADRAIRGRAQGSGRGEAVGPLLAEAGTLYGTLGRACDARQYPEAVAAGYRLKAALAAAYAAAMPARAGEFRGVWDDQGLGLYPGDWDRTCGVLASAGINVVMPCAGRGGMAHYESRILPPSEACQRYGDQVARCVTAAHRAGIQVHVWKMCWNLDGAPPATLATLRREGRLQVTAAGETLNWLCPSHPVNAELELATIRELASRYAIDGIHLDYIRYPSANSCYCAGCRARFEADTGQRIRRWPADVRSGKSAAAYRKWRAGRITQFVAGARAEIRKVNPRVQLSAAVYGWFPGCIETIGQDWGTWLANGYLDFACPMNYTADLGQFRSLLQKEMAAVPASAARLFPGIGVTAAESSLDALQTLDQIAALREAGARGFALYELDKTLENDVLPPMGGVRAGAAR